MTAPLPAAPPPIVGSDEPPMGEIEDVAIVPLHDHFSAPHLEVVVEMMRRLGPPIIRAVRVTPQLWVACEGTHRLRAAHALGLVPILLRVDGSADTERAQALRFPVVATPRTSALLRLADALGVGWGGDFFCARDAMLRKVDRLRSAEPLIAELADANAAWLAGNGEGRLSAAIGALVRWAREDRTAHALRMMTARALAAEAERDALRAEASDS